MPEFSGSVEICDFLIIAGNSFDLSRSEEKIFIVLGGPDMLSALFFTS